MKPLIHIGPPKTGSSSIQKFLIPYCGRPFEIWPDWARALAHKTSFDVPPALPENFILSAEGLGDFVNFPPTVIADRLAQVFPKGTVVWVRRNPLEHFYSWYREVLLINAGSFDQRIIVPHTPNEFFEQERRRFAQSRLGFFSMTDAHGVSIAFSRYFDFHILEFNQLQQNARAFADSFTRIAQVRASPTLGHVNQFEAGRMEETLRTAPSEVPKFVIDRYMECYHRARLSKDREDFIAQREDVAVKLLAAAFRFTRE